MPYNKNPTWVRFEQAMAADWWTLEDGKALLQSMISVDFSVVASRREGHDAVNDFLSGSSPGKEIFSVQTRFPDEGKFFLSSFKSEIGDTVISLASTLSYRPENVAKDTQVGSNVGTGKGKEQTDAGYLAKDQGYQDNFKRFEELTKILRRQVVKDFFTQRLFERKAGVKWEGADNGKPSGFESSGTAPGGEEDDDDEEEVATTTNPGGSS